MIELDSQADYRNSELKAELDRRKKVCQLMQSISEELRSINSRR